MPSLIYLTYDMLISSSPSPRQSLCDMGMSTKDDHRNDLYLWDIFWALRRVRDNGDKVRGW